jgi:uncharacterized cupredoxin-like copper-binding protein
MSTTRLPIVLLVAGVVALAGCGDDDDGGDSAGAEQSTAADTAAQSTPASGAVKLSETEFKITPADVPVEKTGKVTFEVANDGKIDHALEVEGPNGEVETDTIPAGQSATLEVDLSKAGTYEMYCPIGNHRAMGMEGQVSVAGGGSGAAEDSGGDGSDDDGGGGASAY